MPTSQPIGFSYEFFPPRSQRMERRLWRSIGQLERLNARFFSMTYGALGSTQQISIESAISMHQESPVAIAAHLTCANAKAEQINDVAQRYYDAGIRRIVALRGDAAGPDDSGNPVYGYPSAAELVAALLEIGDFDISVAAYPEIHPKAKSANSDLLHLKRKLDLGAERAITQYFFDADKFLRFRDSALRIGIDKPIIPGILPIHDLEMVKDFSQRCGASVPLFYDALFASVKNNPEAQYRLSLDLAVDMCQRLNREGVDQFHLYTLNKTDMCLDISMALGASISTSPFSSVA